MQKWECSVCWDVWRVHKGYWAPLTSAAQNNKATCIAFLYANRKGQDCSWRREIRQLAGEKPSSPEKDDVWRFPETIFTKMSHGRIHICLPAMTGRSPRKNFKLHLLNKSYYSFPSYFSFLQVLLLQTLTEKQPSAWEREKCRTKVEIVSQPPLLPLPYAGPQAIAQALLLRKG